MIKMTKLVCEVCGHLFEAEIEEENFNPDCPKCSNPETKTTIDLTDYETTHEKNDEEK
jgi:rubrerythrin